MQPSSTGVPVLAKNYTRTNLLERMGENLNGNEWKRSHTSFVYSFTWVAWAGRHITRRHNVMSDKCQSKLSQRSLLRVRRRRSKTFVVRQFPICRRWPPLSPPAPREPTNSFLRTHFQIMLSGWLSCRALAKARVLKYHVQTRTARVLKYHVSGTLWEDCPYC